MTDRETMAQIKDVLEAASATLTVYDRTGAQHAQWARQHGGRLLDALKAPIEISQRIEAKAKAENADLRSQLAAAQAESKLLLDAQIKHIMREDWLETRIIAWYEHWQRTMGEIVPDQPHNKDLYDAAKYILSELEGLAATLPEMDCEKQARKIVDESKRRDARIRQADILEADNKRLRAILARIAPQQQFDE